MTHEQNTIIVGGGLAGLTAAAYLAREGRPVTVLESAAASGGRARTRQEAGFWLNLGPHALYNTGPAAAVLRDFGIRLTGRTPSNRGAWVMGGGTLHPLPANPLQLLSSDMLPWRAKWEVARFFVALGKLRIADLRGTSVRTWLDSRFTASEARSFVAALIRVGTYCADEGQSSAIALRQLQLGFGGGVTYLDHGWQTLVDALERHATGRGARIRHRAAVESADEDGVIVNGQRMNGDAVIVATPRMQAARLMGSALRPVDRIPARAACLTFCLSRLPRPDRWFVLGLDAPYYLSVHSEWAKLAPGSGALVHLMKYLAPGESATASELESLMSMAQPGWRNWLVHQEFLPQMFVGDAITAGAESQPQSGRVQVAGDWTGDGILADAAMASGKRAASAVLQQKPSLYESVA